MGGMWPGAQLDDYAALSAVMCTQRKSMTRQYRAKILDFGFSRVVMPARELETSLIIHSLEPIASGMLGIDVTSKTQADESENWVIVSGGDAEFIKKRRSLKAVEFRTRSALSFF